MKCVPVPRIAIDCLNCSLHGSMAEDDLLAHGLEPGSSLVTLTKRMICTKCGSRAVMAYRYVEDDLGPTLVPPN